QENAIDCRVDERPDGLDEREDRLSRSEDRVAARGHGASAQACPPAGLLVDGHRAQTKRWLRSGASALAPRVDLDRGLEIAAQRFAAPFDEWRRWCEEDRAGGPLRDFVGDVAEDERANARAAAGPEDDHGRVELVGVDEDRFVDRPVDLDRLCRRGQARLTCNLRSLLGGRPGELLLPL